MNPKIPFAAILLSCTAMSHAWDDGGHLLIGEIAARQLRPEVAKKVEALLPLLDTQFNNGHAYNLVTAGTWMDDMRSLGTAYRWKSWHYVDAPCAGDTFVEPPPPHALWALDQAVDVLRSKSAEPKARAEALGQIIHLVGDIHQPLHTADRNDKGGNGVHILPLPAASGHGPENLHAFWDAAYRYDAVKGETIALWGYPPHDSRPKNVNEPGVLAEQASRLLNNTPANSGDASIANQPWHAWARETHALACKSGWPQNAENTPIVELSPIFVHTAHEIAEQQIVKAGARLAALLNELFGEEKLKKERQP